MKKILFLTLSCISITAPVAVAGLPSSADGQALRADLHQHYPSLAWVERYRQAYPAEAQGKDALWRGPATPALGTADELVDALAALQDQHIGLFGTKAGKQQTLGVLFRTSSDGAMSVWRHVDPTVASLRVGDQVLSINGMPVARWLEHTAPAPLAAIAAHAWPKPRSSLVPSRRRITRRSACRTRCASRCAVLMAARVRSS